MREPRLHSSHSTKTKTGCSRWKNYRLTCHRCVAAEVDLKVVADVEVLKGEVVAAEEDLVDERVEERGPNDLHLMTMEIIAHRKPFHSTFPT